MSGVDPMWSPDGQRLVYTYRDRGNSVHTAFADGSHDAEVSVPDAPFGTGWASWSADGQHLLLEGDTRLGAHAVFTDDLSSAKATQLIDDAHAGDEPGAAAGDFFNRL